MKRCFLTLAALCLWAVPAAAQTYFANVQLTIDNTAAGIRFTASDIQVGNGHPQVNSAACVSNTSGGDFRFRVDGTAPTTSVGVLVPAGATLTFTNAQALLAFRGIRTASTSAVLSCTLSNGTVPPIVPGASGSGGSGSGGDVNITEVGGNAVTTTVPVSGFLGGIITHDNAAATDNRVTTLPGITETSAPTRTNGRDAALSLTVGGAARVMLTDAAGAALTVSTDGTFDSAVPATGPAIGLRAETTNPTDVGDGDLVSPMADVDGQQFTIQSATTNPLSAGTDCVLITTASTNATTCKASAGNLYGYEFINTTATLAYVRLYNLAANPTCSSATGFIRSIPVPASATGSGVVRDFTVPVNYGTGIAFCATGGGSSTDNTNAPAGVYLNFIYK